MKRPDTNNGTVARKLWIDPGRAPPKKRRDRRVVVDGRTKAARRWRSLYTGYLAKAPQQEQLCRQAATVLQREQLDVKLARGEDVNVDLLVRLSGAIARTLERL